MRKLFNWRKRTPVLHTGKLQHFAPVDGVYVYFRYDGKDTMMVALNRNPATSSLALDRFAGFIQPGSRGRDALSGAEVTLGTSLSLPAKSATILRIE